MRRYDQAWERGYGARGRAPYDRLYRSGDAAWGGPPPGGRGRGYSPLGGYEEFGGYLGYDRFRGRSGYWRDGFSDRGSGRRGPGGGYFGVYPGSLQGRRSPFGGAEPGRPGPYRGYPWDRGGPYDAPFRGSGDRPGGWRRAYPGPYDGPYGGEEWVQYSEEWEFPAGYVDERFEDFFDEDEEESIPWEADDGEWDETAGGAWLEAPDDDELRERVMRSLQSDGFLDADAIRVEAKDGVVTLRGEVGDYMEARYAWDDAWDAPGVHGVISKLRVRQVASPAGDAAGPAAEKGQGRAQGGKREG